MSLDSPHDLVAAGVPIIAVKIEALGLASPAAKVQPWTFNRWDRSAAAALLRSCLDVDRWVDELVEGRPFPDVDTLLQAARQTAPLTAAELNRVCPLLPSGHRSQPTVVVGAPLPQLGPGALTDPALIEHLMAYQDRFGRPFVIRAAGRSWLEIAAKLGLRLTHKPDREDQIIAAEMHQIALLRLARLL